MIVIKDVKIETGSNKLTSYEIEVNSTKAPPAQERHAINFSVNSYQYSDMDSIGIEPAVLAVLPRAMIEGHTISSKYKLDPVFLSNIGFYLRRMKLEPQAKDPMWLKHIELFKKSLYVPKIEIEPKDTLGYSTQTKVGLFYSGGVDSLYSLVTCGEVSEVIHVENFNRNYQDTTRALTLLKRLRPEVRLSRVTTNLIEPNPKHWDLISHGTFVAAVGHLFRDRFTRLFISGTDTFLGSDSGTGPDINYLFSSSRVRFGSYGDVYKIEKYKRLLQHPEASFIFDNFQVCPHPRKKVNCSECSECLINMLMIDSLRASSFCHAFDFNGMLQRAERVGTEAHPYSHPYFFCMLPLIAKEYQATGRADMADFCNRIYERAKK